MQSNDKPVPGSTAAVRFGQFRFDPKAGVLERNGHRVRLTYQASATLSLLIERRGEIVTREELQQALWQGEVVTDYESGIYRTMSLLRACLRDRSRKVQLIETLPKRGYRFRAEIVAETGSPTVLAQGALPEWAMAEPIADVRDSQNGSATTSVVTIVVPAPSAALVAAALPQGNGSLSSSSRPGVLRKRWGVVGGAAALLLTLLAGVALVFAWRAAQGHTAGGPRIVRLQLDGADQETKGRADLLEHQVVADFAGIPHLELRAGAAAANPTYLTVTGLLSHDGDGYHLTLAVERANGAQMGTLAYNIPKASITALHLQIQHDLYSQYLRPIALEQAGAARAGTQDGRAYELYLQAQPLIAERTTDSLTQAEMLLRQAVTRDPGFAQARARLALASMLGNFYSDAPDEKRFAQSAAWARLALEGDASLGEAHAVLGFLAYHQQWQFAAAERELRDAVRFDPENVQFRSWLATALSYKGKGDAAVEQIHLARLYDEQSRFLRINEVGILGNAGRYNEMLTVAQSNLKGNENDQAALEQAGWALWTVGRYEEAIQTWIRRARVAGDSRSATIETEGLAQLRRSGMRGYAAFKAKSIAAGKISTSPASSQELAEWYGFAGDREAALRILEQEVANRDDAVLSTRVNPAFFLLYGDVRFTKLLHRLNLEDRDPAFSTYASLPITSAE